MRDCYSSRDENRIDQQVNVLILLYICSEVKTIRYEFLSMEESDRGEIPHHFDP